MSLKIFVQNQFYTQECIPVGCVPPATVAVRGGSPHPPGSRLFLLAVPPEQAPPIILSDITHLSMFETFLRAMVKIQPKENILHGTAT